MPLKDPFGGVDAIWMSLRTIENEAEPHKAGNLSETVEVIRDGILNPWSHLSHSRDQIGSHILQSI